MNERSLFLKRSEQSYCSRIMHQQHNAEQGGLLGKLCPGDKKLEGKTFYLDNVKKRATDLLLEAISLLGGRIESFLHKDVNFVVTGSQEGLKEERHMDKGKREKAECEKIQHPLKRRGNVQQQETPRPVACGSRGKALLEKAIRNNERLQGKSVLTNARSWGVQILYVDDVVLYLKQVTRESCSTKHKKPERSNQHGSHVVKAAPLKSPYIKIEDCSRKYKPLHMQSMIFPLLQYLSKFSPFESPPHQFDKKTEEEESKTREKEKGENSIQDKSKTPVNCNPSLWRPRKKDSSYCECCHQPFTNLEEHLQSEQHRMFVQDPSNYNAVDQLIADMFPGFDFSPSEQREDFLSGPPTPLPFQDVCELEPLTDGETERAVQALHKQSSSLNAHILCPAGGPLSIVLDSPSTEVQIPIPSPATPPADIKSFIPRECQIPDIRPCASSPTMPVLDVEPQAHDSVTQCTTPDPYSLPPVLSPQVHYSSYITDPHDPYSEPPVLSPQQYTEEVTVDGALCEMDTAEGLSQSVSAVSLPVSTDVCSHNGLDYNKQPCYRSRSLSQQPTPAPNSRKRCRSTSSDCIQSKRTRTTDNLADKISRWTKRGLRSTKSECDIIAQSGGCLLFNENCCQILQSSVHQTTSSTYTGESLDFKEAVTLLSVPTVKDFTRTPTQMDILGHGSASVFATPPEQKTFNPPYEFPIEKSHCRLSSQDSQCSLSHYTSVCIESALIPDLAMLSPSSSDSDWDCDLLSRLGATSASPLLPAEANCELDKELLHKPCTWMHGTSYESHLHTVLQPSAPAPALCVEDMDSSNFTRTVVSVVEVQH